MDLTAYGVLASDNSLWVTIVNKTIETGSITADLNIDLGGNYSNGNMWLMQAPNNDDSQTTGITLGGGEVGVNGTWSGTSEPVSVFGGTATVILSPASAAVIQFVPGTGGCSAAPSAPTALAATASSSSAIGLTWKAPATIPANCSVIGYKILGGTTANPNAVIGSVSGTTTTFSNTGLTAATTYYYLVEALDADGPSALSNQASASTQAVGTSTEVVSINAGGPAVSDSGGGDNSFVADEDFSAGGTTASTGNTITIPASIAATAAPMAVYQSARQGTVTYTIPGLTAGGSYTVRLHFAEIYFSAAGQRVFDVAINGTAVLTNFDIYATVGAKYTAMVENFTATANSSGDIVIAFTNGTTNQPMFNGIEVLSNSKGVTECSAAPSAPTGLAASGTSSTGTTLSWTADSAPANCTISSYTVLKNGASIGTATGTSFAVTGLSASTAYSFTVEATDSVGTSPASSALDVTTTASGSGGDFIAINSEGPAVSNSGGGDASFAADEDFTGGGKATPTTHAISTTAAGANAAPMAVYQTQRDETFTYTIPGMVANSQHTVLLHFAEIYFSAAGDREFNVAINSTPVLTNFDVYAAAGGEYIAVVKSFTATANSSGQIVIAYTSGAKNQPSAAGLEIR
jgi:chitodextrinase